jgi:hypothetical protein
LLYRYTINRGLSRASANPIFIRQRPAGKSEELGNRPLSSRSAINPEMTGIWKVLFSLLRFANRAV